MPEKQIESQIITYLQSPRSRPLRPRKLARELGATAEDEYHAFRNALRQLMREGRVVLGGGGAVVLPTQKQSSGAITGVYRHNRKGFGFVVPRDPASHEDLYIPQGENGGAINGDIVSAKITNQRRGAEGKTLYEGRVMEILERTQKRFVGTLVKQHNQWLVIPDGKSFTEPILTPDAASRHVKPGAKVVVELTTYPSENQPPAGVITDILGKAGEKDVDLKSVIVQFNLPAEFPDEVLGQARVSIDKFNSTKSWPGRMDLSDEVICTIDPDDAKDFDDAISLNRLEDGNWELGVHIADVSFFVPTGSPLDQEAEKRGNSCYFPGHVIPMLPEMLSNGVCSLQEGVPRLCKSAFITFDEDARPIRTRFANTVINSAQRLRYREAQAIIDKSQQIPHPDGPRRLADYPSEVVELLDQMNVLAKRIQRRRLEQGQIVLELPEVELVLDEEGKVVGTAKEDTSFTHTLIEMFMVEANEAVARLFDSMNLPFMRRIHPEPEPDSAARLQHFVQVAGYRLPKDLNRKAIQYLLATVRGKPESFAINLAVLKSLARAEYSPEPVGHFALASEHYCHFTSPIRRYADLLVHRLLDSYFNAQGSGGGGKKQKKKIPTENVIPYDQLQEIGRHISLTERRADDAERELRQVKILELLKDRVGEQFMGVVTGITNFGIFVQISEYLVDGLIRYEDLMDDWWDVDERAGQVRGQRTGKKIGIGDVVKVTVVNVNIAVRELNLAITELIGRAGRPQPQLPEKSKHAAAKQKTRHGRHEQSARGGGARRGKPFSRRGRRR